ncbi:MAG TPA: class I SAM-dependent methyltransferase [Mycobacteriales bacterium]|jgi:hypothetical protein|nr:class I SAM-dependent methyltransferase [Mycobacteriales bacterium]
MDWQKWHTGYDQPGSGLAERLRAVQAQLRVALDSAGPGPLRAISVCAGQGRDLIGVLAGHPRRNDVTARLVELDPRIADVARESVHGAGLRRVEVVTGDAAALDQYLAIAPADLVLLCGIFGNISEADIERTIDLARGLVRTGGTVVWTRGRGDGDADVVPRICRWFEERPFQRLWLSPPDVTWGVGAHRFTGEPTPLPPGTNMFTFIRH